MRKILVVAGNYSEAILMAPLVQRLRTMPSLQTLVYVADQHRQLFDRILGSCVIQPDEESDPFQQEQIEGKAHCIDRMIERHQPDCVLAHGDSTTAMGSLLLNNPAGSLEAGLRMYELHYPGSRRAACREIDLVSTYYFVPSEAARDNLLIEGVAAEKIYLTDSVVIDALQMVAERIRNDDALKADISAAFPFLDSNRHLILVAGDRRGNRDERLESLCRAMKRLAIRPDVHVVYSLHPDLRMSGIVDEMCADIPNITLVQPQDYIHFVHLMQTAYLVLTNPDEPLIAALSLKKPVLVMSDTNGRLDAVDEGSAKQVGTDGESILRECTMFLDDPSYYRAYSGRNSSGDGHASQRIVETLLR